MLWRPPACCTAFEDRCVCEHKQRFFDLLAFVGSQQIPIGFAPDGAAGDAYKIGRAHVDPSFCIDLWPTAYAIYGWDVVSSTLIHEFGHCKLYEMEKRGEESVEVEILASEYGRRFTPVNLIPDGYDHYRTCFLESYKANPRWTKEEWLAKWSRMNTPERVKTSGA